MASTQSKSGFDSSDSALLEQMPTVSFICEHDEFYTMRNLSASVLRMLGYKPEEFIDNKKIFAASVIHPEDLDVVDEFAEAVFKSREAITARFRLVRSDKTVIQALFVSRTVRDSKTDSPVGFSGTVIDISDLPAFQGPAAILSSR